MDLDTAIGDVPADTMAGRSDEESEDQVIRSLETSTANDTSATRFSRKVRNK